jgi:Spt4/RpoE2 zinc finger
MIAMMQAKESWVAKWNNLNQPGLVPGTYAISVYQLATIDNGKVADLFEGDEED